MTRAWLIFWISCASLSSGCATAPSPDPWSDLEASVAPAQQPVSLPEWPQETSSTPDTVSYDLDAVRQMLAHRVTAQGNYEIAAANADQIDELNKAAGHLIEAGRAQRRVSDLRLEILMEERRHHAIEKAALWGGMILVIGAAATL